MAFVFDGRGGANQDPPRVTDTVDDNAILVIYVDLISCLLKVECYFLLL